MGLNWHGVKFLAGSRDGVDFGRTITIGRLNLNVSLPKVRQILEEYGLPHSLTDEDVLGRQGYSEPVFKLLGADTVDSMDASDYEQATVVADLNKPIPEELHEKYDLVYDGGTIEHVFNVPQGLKNLMSLPKVGGRVIIQTMANNWFGHGFYQFSPELFYRVFTADNGYHVMRVVIHGSFELAQWYDVPDPAEVRGRIELANGWHGLMITVHAKRDAVIPIFEKTPQQSDYSARWDSGGTAPPFSPGQRGKNQQAGTQKATDRIAQAEISVGLALEA